MDRRAVRGSISRLTEIKIKRMNNEKENDSVAPMPLH